MKELSIAACCHNCRFFSETEDGACYCCIYNKEWEIDEDGSFTGTAFSDGMKPEFCKAEKVTVHETVDINGEG